MFCIVSCDSPIDDSAPETRRWVVEATTERQAIELVRNSIGESARLAGLVVSALTDDERRRDPALQSLGVTEVIVEIGADTAGHTDGWEPEFLIQPLSVRDEAVPSWLPTGLWPQLLVTPDSGRAYGIATADVWDAAAPGAEMRAVPLWDNTLLATDKDAVAQNAPVLVDLSLDSYSDTPPTSLHRLLAILGKRTPMILRSKLDLPELQRDLRKLVMVEDERGRDPIGTHSAFPSKEGDAGILGPLVGKFKSDSSKPIDEDHETDSEDTADMGYLAPKFSPDYYRSGEYSASNRFVVLEERDTSLFFQLVQYAEGILKRRITYVPTGPNSNSYAMSLAEAAGLPRNKPSGDAPGSGMKL